MEPRSILRSSILLRAVFAIAFGVMVLVWPGAALVAFVVAFGLYAIIDGIGHAGTSYAAWRRREPWVLQALAALAGVGAGILTFVWPGLTAVVLVAIVGWWALFVGILQIVTAIRLRRIIEGEWLLGLAGFAAALLGTLIVTRPGIGWFAVTYVVAIFSIAWGAVLLGLAWRFRDVLHPGAAAPPMPRPAGA